VATNQITPDNDAIITEIFIAAPPARVFTALIDRVQALQWGTGPMFEMALWELDPRAGGKLCGRLARSGYSDQSVC
jgi:uncharacterized protein YndB with AHSA1/START domain